MSDETIAILGRYVWIFIFVLYIIQAYLRAKSNWEKSKRFVMLLVSCSVLLIISTIAGIPKPVTFWSDFIHMTTMLYSMFLAYIVSRHLWERREFINVLNDPFLIVTTITVALILYADLHRTNFGVITDNDSVDINVYYLPHLISYILMTIFPAVVMYNLYNSAASDRSMEYRARAYTTTIAFAFIAICCLSVVINILFAYTGDFSHRTELNEIYHYGKIIYFPLLYIAMMLSEETVSYLIRPIRNVQKNRKVREQEQIRRLHQKMVSIVPGIRLEYGRTTIDDMLVEIADARDVLWTHIQHDGSISSRFEARAIHSLENQKIVLDGWGQYERVLPPANEREYNLEVEKHLSNLS